MAPGVPSIAVSVIIPTYNGASKIERCLTALRGQDFDQSFDVIVVNDGSTDGTSGVLAKYPEVRVITQANAGPAAARNRGVREAVAEIIVFTDDDCEPLPNWLTEMFKPFADPEVVGAKGVYRTRQREIISRFVQADYEDRYRLMARQPTIDFIDTYSAAFRRARFLEMDGYDTSFPVACAEDVELSYRMAGKGWRMLFVPDAIVYHLHPNTFAAYLKKKFKFAFWRVLAVKKNPSKAVNDSHTPPLMKLQLLFCPVMFLAILGDFFHLSATPLTLIVLLGFLLTVLPFSVRVFGKDPVLGTISPLITIARSCAQFLGVFSGVSYSILNSAIAAFQPVPVRKL